jgi:hypothetical protein
MATGTTAGAAYLILTQVASRALTFIGNQVLLRYLSPYLLGTAVQLEVLSVTVLYSARESLRVALQRRPQSTRDVSVTKSGPEHGRQSQSTVNLSYAAVVLGVIIGLILGPWYLRLASLEVLNGPCFRNVFLIYCAATAIELSAETCFLLIQQHSLFATRAGAETLAAISRCTMACFTAYYLNSTGYPPSVLPSAVGQLNYAIVLFILYLLPAISLARIHSFSLLPTTIPSPSYLLSIFHIPTLQLASTMYLQSIFKLLLTEGDSLILAAFSSLTDQGAFALAANYGGLLARLVFQPIEESSRNTFGRLLSQSPSTADTKRALEYLSSLLHFYTLFSLPLITLIPPLVPIVTPYLFSSAFRTPVITSLLANYIYYIPFMAVNGILDAFVTSVATPATLRRQSLAMAVFTGIYAVTAWVLLQYYQLGAKGLVWANMVNMLMRIGWSVWYVGLWIKGDHEEKIEVRQSEQLRKMFWRDCRPHWSLIVLTVVMLVDQWLINASGLKDGLRGQDEILDVRRMGVLGAEVAVMASAM